MIDKRKVTAIILVAGNSTRYGQNRNKNFSLTPLLRPKEIKKNSSSF